MTTISTLPEDVPNLQWYAGDTYTFPSFTFEESGVPIDLTSYTWAAQWRATPTSTTAVDIALDITQLAVGKITPSVTAEQSETMVGAGVWDLQSTKAGVVKTWIRGNTSVRKDVTNG